MRSELERPAAPHRAASKAVPAACLLAAGLAWLFWLERRRPLRVRVEPATRRQARNLALAAFTAAFIRAVEAPIVQRVAAAGERRGWGLLPLLPARARRLAALLLLDYTLYLWHILLHRVPLLWRSHLVHHADLDLDASTALRFHALEFLWSLPWRMAQVALIGVPRRTLALWQKLTLAEVVFHHSNLRLPLGLERVLSRLVATPRLHGIHHSTRADERNANYSSGLALWDDLHGTARRDVPQDAITIGLPEYREPRQVRLGWSLLRPLAGARLDVSPAWRPLARP